MVPKLLIFLLGVAGGSLITYKAIYQVMEEKYDDAIEKAKEHYKYSEETEEAEDAPDEYYEPTKEEKTAYANVVQHTGYNTCFENNGKEKGGLEPYIITSKELASNCGDCELFEVTFYEGDHVLVDQDEDLIDIDKVGEENLTKFGDDNKIIVRNNYLGIVYEITRDKRSYAKDVLGVVEYE